MLIKAPMDKHAKKPCDICGKEISRNNMSIHKKKCMNKIENPTAAHMNELLERQKQKYENEIQQHKIEIEKQEYKISALEQQVKTLTTQLQCDRTPIVNNNTYNVDMDVTNHFYVISADGLRDGLDMKKLRSFGSENIDYIDSSKPLPTILKNIYCNKDHLENQVLSHRYLNLQWILFKNDDHVLALNLGIDNDNMHVMVKLIVENVQHLLQKEFPNGEERWDAVRELLNEMNREVDDMRKRMGNTVALSKLPLWNKDQFSNYEEREWMRYMDMANYSQQLKRIDTKKWDSY